MTSKRGQPNDLEQSPALLRAVVEGVTDAVFVKDRQGRYLMMNSAGASLLGKSVEEVVGKDDSVLFTPETLASIIQGDRTIIATGETQTQEEEVATAAGITRTYLTTKGPYRDAKGSVIGIVGIARDVTEWKTLQAERDRLLELLRLQIDRLPLAYILMDASYRVLDWNPAAEKIFGYTKEEAIGRVCLELIEPRPSDRIQAVVRRVEAGDMDAHTVNDNRTKDDRIITCAWSNTPLMDSDGRFVGVISLAEDITERRRAEEERERLHQEVSASRNRLRALSRQLLEAQEIERRNVARELHDEIGQVLTAVSMSLKQAKSASGPAAHRWLDESLEIVKQAIRQVRDLSLDLRPAILDDFGLAAALRWYLDQQQQRAHCQIIFDVDSFELPLPPELNTACFRIVQEAITNVLRHAHARHVWVELRQSEEEVRLAVRDDGVGFDPHDARQRAFAGASVGILGMQERVVLLGGQFELESSRKQGTEVRVRLRVHRKARS